MPGFLSPRKGVPLLLIPEYSGINKGQRVPDRSETAHRKPFVKCFLTPCPTSDLQPTPSPCGGQLRCQVGGRVMYGHVHACSGTRGGQIRDGCTRGAQRPSAQARAAAGEEGQRRHVDPGVRIMWEACHSDSVDSPRRMLRHTRAPTPPPALLILKDFQAFKNIFSFFFFFSPSGHKARK